MACVRKRRGKWVIDFYDELGKRHWETVGTNKKEAEDRLARIRLQMKEGTLDPVSSKALLREYCENWLDTYTHVNNLKASTTKSYREALDNYILPLMGHMPLRSIKKRQVKKLITDLGKRGISRRTEKGLSRNSVRIILATLRAILNSVVDDDILVGNPAQKVGKFTKSRTECIFRGMPAGYSRACRPPIPV